MRRLLPAGLSLFRSRLGLERLLAGGIGLLLALPLIQRQTGFPPDVPLGGVEARAPRPVFSPAAWLDGSYAPAVEVRFLERLGLRGVLVHLACQANYSLFGRLAMSGGTEVVRGRDYWLFVRPDIKWAVRQPGYSEKKAALFADRAARVHQALARRGVAFAVVLAPSKAEIASDKLPPGVVLPPRDPANAYARLVPQLEKRGVPLLDGHRLFLALREREPFLFPPAGLHWSYHGAWLAWQELARLLRGQPACPELPDQPVERIEWSQPLGADADLRELLNLWRFEPGGPAKAPYPVVAPPPPELRNCYAALVCGDSFAYGLIDAMGRSGLFRRADLLYYFKRRYAYPAPAFAAAEGRLIGEACVDEGPLDKAGPDWAALLEGRQFVFLVLDVVHIRDEGWGFLESLLAAQERPAG